VASSARQRTLSLLTGIAAGQGVSLALLLVMLVGLMGAYASVGDPNGHSPWVHMFTFGMLALMQALARLILWMLILMVAFTLLAGGALLAWMLVVRSSAQAGRGSAPGSAQGLGWTMVALGGVGLLETLPALFVGPFALLPLLWSLGAITMGILLANAAADWKREQAAQPRGWQPVGR
jgi:hypothetical protein